MTSTAELAPRYDAAQVETKWYERWEAAGLFSPAPSDGRRLFTITIPPPNITGSLHMGHSLCYPMQDLIGRYRRLRGDSVLIVPGQDHAGIATQSVVSKQLKREGQSPSALGREAFVQRVWEWRRESGDTIVRQFRQLGCSFDWSRSRFTLDEKYAEAVLKVFIEWFDQGLIYRGERVVNWDPILQTSVSDIETERRLVRGKLYKVRYPFSDGNGHVVIATTRPETMLADVAVAVHPSDRRYTGVVGRMLDLPLAGRQIPIIADIYPDPEFGTGAVKITPAHDANDFEVGRRHDLPSPTVLDDQARMTSDCGQYAGLDRLEARKRIVQDLEASGLLESVEDHDIALVVSERSGEPVEPLLREQWFARQTELAQPAIAAVEDGRIKFVPERYSQIFVDWLSNIRDWNVSRKLWWGHRIPVYYTASGKAVAALSEEEAAHKAGEPIIRQDDEVLDTWFSSGLWPFATLGWPEQTADLQERYPTNVLVTDRNIINLWVARMAMMGLHFVGREPFKTVYIHATVMTEDGRRMSKSLGTGVDPVEVIERIGADALRFTLLSQAGDNQEIRYSERKTDDARNFCNKIWNAARFVLMGLEGYDPNAGAEPEVIDRWLLSRLADTQRKVSEAYEAYDVQAAAQALQSFFWGEMCDWYIEIAKSRLHDPARRATPQSVLLEAFECFLTMLHPIMPFITEELYQHFPFAGKAEFLMGAKWIAAGKRDAGVEATVGGWLEAVRAARALRAEMDIGPLKAIPELYWEGELQGGEEVLRTQAWVQELKRGKPAAGRYVSSGAAGIEVHLPIEGLVDTDKELGRIDREHEKALGELQKLEGRLGNPQFVERAKPEVVERERAAAEALRETIAKLETRRRLFSESQ